MNGYVVVISKIDDKQTVKKFKLIEELDNFSDIYEEALDYFCNQVETIKKVTEDELAKAMANQFFVVPNEFVTITVIEEDGKRNI